MFQIQKPAVCAGLILTLAASTAAAQTLIDPARAPRAMDIIQFGVPRDARFIFCGAHDCPERTTKTLTEPRVAAPAPIISRLGAPFVTRHVVAPPAELSHAKVKPAPKKKPIRKKRPVQYRCGPDSMK